MLVRQWEVYRASWRIAKVQKRDLSKTTLTLDSDKQKQFLRKTLKTKTKSYHRHDKTELQNVNAAGSAKTIQEHSKNRDRLKIYKTRHVLKRPNKISDMHNKLHVSTYIKTISGETNQHPNEKRTTKTYRTNITLDVQLQHTDIN